MSIEREVKIPVPSFDGVRPLLGQIDAKFLGTEQEVNRILDNAERVLYQRHQILRVRSTPDGVLTWKGVLREHQASGHKVRTELEVHVAAQEVETLLQLLEGLGFTEVLRYEKERDTWQWRGIQVMLDSLVFGQFVEIEGNADDIESAVQALGLDGYQRETRSYPELQQQYQDAHKP